MSQTFYDVIVELGPNTALSVNLYSKILVWTEDYEKEWYFLYDQIPKEAQYFWANRFGVKSGKLFKYERYKNGWLLMEKAKALTRESMKRITCGPAFKGVPPILKPPNYVKWIH